MLEYLWRNFQDVVNIVYVIIITHMVALKKQLFYKTVAFLFTLICNKLFGIDIEIKSISLYSSQYYF